MRSASERAAATSESASRVASRMISVLATILTRSAWASSTIRSASSRPSAMTEPRSSRICCAVVSSPGSILRSSSMRSRISTRLTMQDADIGIARAVSSRVESSSSLAWMSIASRLAGLVSRSVVPSRQLRGELADDGRRHEPGDVPAEQCDFFDQARGQEAVERVRRHEQRLDLRERMVHLSHLQLVVEVADRAQTFDDDADPVGFAEVDEQSVE